jgi:hypothetical protein
MSNADLPREGTATFAGQMNNTVFSDTGTSLAVTSDALVEANFRSDTLIGYLDNVTIGGIAFTAPDTGVALRRTNVVPLAGEITNTGSVTFKTEGDDPYLMTGPSAGANTQRYQLSASATGDFYTQGSGVGALKGQSSMRVTRMQPGTDDNPSVLEGEEAFSGGGSAPFELFRQ